MTDPKIDIKQFVAKEETAAKAWFGSNWVPVAVGIVIGMALEFIIHKI